MFCQLEKMAYYYKYGVLLLYMYYYTSKELRVYIHKSHCGLN